MAHLPYAIDGLVGCATPQANPTVEAELRRLLPWTVNLQINRSVASGESEARLRAYFGQLDQTLEGFGGMALDAFGFACTGPSYLLEPGEEDTATRALEARFGYPVCTAAEALRQALQTLGARRLLIGSPYPAWLHERCLDFWQRAGFEVVGHCCTQAAMGDTQAIYALDETTVADRLTNALTGLEADALLLTGTGLPTLAMRPGMQQALGMPVLSANLCLAWSLMRLARPGSRHARHLEQELFVASDLA